MMRLLARLLAVVTMMWCASASAELPPVTSHTTPGGITFRHVQIDGLPRHTIAFGWHDAFARTMPGKEGLATLGRWLINEGSATLTRSDYSERLKDLQAATSFAGSTFHTTGSLTAPADKLGEAAALFGDLLANPALAPDHFALLQKSIAAGARQAAERPETLAHLMMRRLTLGPGPDLDATVVAPEAYARLSVADVTAWHKAVLVQDTVLIASAGPMQPHAVAREIDRLFAGLPKSSPAPVATPPVPKLPARGKTVVLERPVVQTIIVAEGPSGWVNSPDAVRDLGPALDARVRRAPAACGPRAAGRRLRREWTALCLPSDGGEFRDLDIGRQ